MKAWLAALLTGLMLVPAIARSETDAVWRITLEDGTHLTEICYEPEAGDRLFC